MVRKSLGWSGAELNTKMPAGAYTVSSEEVRLRDPLHLLTCLLASAASVAVVAVAALRSLHIYTACTCLYCTGAGMIAARPGTEVEWLLTEASAAELPAL